MLNNNDYLRISTMRSLSITNINGDYLNVKSNGESDTFKHLDNLGNIKSVSSDIPVSKEPMEVVPLILLDSDDCGYDKNLIESNTTDDYLKRDSNSIINTNQNNTSYSSTSSDVSPPPPYSLVV